MMIRECPDCGAPMTLQEKERKWVCGCGYQEGVK